MFARDIQTAQREMIELSQKPEVNQIFKLRDLKFVKRVFLVYPSFSNRGRRRKRKRNEGIGKLNSSLFAVQKIRKIVQIMQRKQKLFNAAGQNISSRINQVG